MLYILPTNTCFWIACPIKEIESYKKIYEIKNRPLDKAIAIMVDSFEYFEKNTKLTKNQIDFLKNYKNPWTILIDKEKIFDKNLLKIINSLPNSEIYEKIAFRVAHTFMHRRLIQDKGLLFLTSANHTGKWEIFSTKDIKKSFWKLIKKEELRLFAHPEYCIKTEKKYSDIFEFESKSKKVIYFRK